MDCKWCGSGRHDSDNCPTFNLSQALRGQPHDPEKLPDYVSMMPLNDLLEKTEEELHDEIKNLGKISRNNSENELNE